MLIVPTADAALVGGSDDGTAVDNALHVEQAERLTDKASAIKENNDMMTSSKVTYEFIEKHILLHF